MPFSLERTPLENGVNLISALNEAGNVVAQLFINAAGEVVGAFENSKDHLLEISTRYQDLSDPSRHSTTINLVNANDFYDRPVSLYLNHNFWGEGDQYKQTIENIPLNMDRSPVAVAQALSAQVGAGGLRAKAVTTANETTYIVGSEQWGLGGRDSLAVMIMPKPGQVSTAFLANVPVNNNLYIDIIEATGRATGSNVKFNGLNIDFKSSTSSVQVVEYTPDHFKIMENGNGWQFVYGNDVSTGQTLPLTSFDPKALIDNMEAAYGSSSTIEASPSLSVSGSGEGTASGSLGDASKSPSVKITETVRPRAVASRSWTETVSAGARRISSTVTSATRSIVDATKSIDGATATASLVGTEAVKRLTHSVTASATEYLTHSAEHNVTATHALPSAGVSGEDSNVTMIAAVACCGVAACVAATILYRRCRGNSSRSAENGTEGGISSVALLELEGGRVGIDQRDAASVSSDAGIEPRWVGAMLGRKENPLNIAVSV